MDRTAKTNFHIGEIITERLIAYIINRTHVVYLIEWNAEIPGFTLNWDLLYQRANG